MWFLNYSHIHKLEKLLYRLKAKNDLFRPPLVGMRVLDNGRLALAFWNELSEEHEYRVADIWVNYDRYRGHCFAGKWFDLDWFRKAYLFDGAVHWDSVGELHGCDLYDIGVSVKIPDGCSGEEVFGCLA